MGHGPVDLTIQYRLLAGGNVLEERVFAGTPHEMVTLLEKLERGEIISPAASKGMIELMKREQGTNGIWRAQCARYRAAASMPMAASGRANQ